jgi:hypothetical protein
VERQNPVLTSLHGVYVQLIIEFCISNKMFLMVASGIQKLAGSIIAASGETGRWSAEFGIMGL